MLANQTPVESFLAILNACFKSYGGIEEIIHICLTLSEVMKVPIPRLSLEVQLLESVVSKREEKCVREPLIFSAHIQFVFEHLAVPHSEHEQEQCENHERTHHRLRVIGLFHFF
jgi:hypothetical protein